MIRTNINVDELRSAIQRTLRPDAYHPMIEYYQALSPTAALTLLDHIATLEACVAVNQKDAERYRWLRKLEDGIEFRDSSGVRRSDCPSSEELDGIIDRGIVFDTSTQEVG